MERFVRDYRRRNNTTNDRGCEIRYKPTLWSLVQLLAVRPVFRLTIIINLMRVCFHLSDVVSCLKLTVHEVKPPPPF